MSKKPLLLLAIVLLLSLVVACGSDPTQDTSQANTEVTGTSWEKAKDYVGEWRAITGPYVGLRSEGQGHNQPTYLILGAPYPDPTRFEIVIMGRDLSRFPESLDVYYSHATITVTGEIEDREGIASVHITNPTQIKIA